jgi:5-methylcytosine-specific restriction endonuclease McrA
VLGPPGGRAVARELFPGGPGGVHLSAPDEVLRAHGGGPLDTAAEALGISRADLFERLRDGKSLEDVAKAQGKSIDDVKAAMRAGIRKDLDDAVDAGKLTAAEADRMADKLTEGVRHFPDWSSRPRTARRSRCSSARSVCTASCIPSGAAPRVATMLREVKDAAFERRLTLAGWRYQATWDPALAWGSRRFGALRERQAIEPVALHDAGRRRYWLFEDRVYWEDDELEAADVRALIREREHRRRRRLERAHALAATAVLPPGGRRTPIPRALRAAVWERDGGACVDCGARFDLQYDHVIPVALGGAGTLETCSALRRAAAQGALPASARARLPRPRSGG